MYQLGLGVAANDGKGTPARTGGAGINWNWRLLEWRTGHLGALPIAMSGNSMAGYGSLHNWAGYHAVARMLHGDRDVLIATNAYYDNIPPDYPVRAVGQRGMNFGAGARDTVQMLNFQMKYMLEAHENGWLHPVIWCDPWQNDRFNTTAEANASMDRVKQFINTFTVLGYTVVLVDVYPQNSLNDASGKHSYRKYLVSERMQEWCRVQPGVLFMPLLDLVRAYDPVREQQGFLDWAGPVAGIGGATNDGIHSSVYGARLIAPRVAEIYDILVGSRKYRKPSTGLMSFDYNLNPRGSFFGGKGALIGTGGFINGTASNDMPAGVELFFDPSKNYTVVPKLTGDPLRPLRLTVSGTPSANDFWAIRNSVNQGYNPGTVMETHAKARWIGANNVSGLATGQGEGWLPSGSIIKPLASAGSAGGISHIMPFQLDEGMILRSHPFGYGNEYAQTTRLDLSSAVVKDLPVSGVLEVSYLDMIPTDNYLRSV